MIERILVPLDGSRMAESVMPLVLAVARCTGACVTLLHIIEERPPRNIHGEPHLATVPEAQQYLRELDARLLDGASVEMHVHEAEEHDVAQSVAAHADELRADLVVLCTHGRSGPRRVVWGSIAQQVLRRARIPVLLVRSDMRVPSKISVVLLALDGSAGAEAAIPIATEMAQACKARVEVVRVVPTASTLSGDEAALARLVPTATDAALDVEAAQTVPYLERITQLISGGSEKVASQILRGEPVQMVAEAAQRCDASIIALATHARSGIGALWIGSVGAGLSSSSDRPLLLVRIPDGLAGDKD